jgi:hypothetical protein
MKRLEPPKPLPQALHNSFRITEILQGATRIDPAVATPAVRYLQSLAPGVDLGGLDLNALRQHRALNHWASKAGSMPALILKARRSANDKTSALVCIFLDQDGRRAAISAPQLAIGACDGALVVLQDISRHNAPLFLCENFETAMRLVAKGTAHRVAYGLRRENMARVVLVPGAECLCVFEREIDHQENAIVAALRERGIITEAVTKSVALAPFHSRVEEIVF